YAAATACEFDPIMRVTCDCPLLNPQVCSAMLKLFLEQKPDYMSNSWPVRTFAKGHDCEIFTFDCLEAAHLKAKSPYEREHVTPWMQTTKGIKRICFKNNIDLSHHNYCVDYPEDIARLEAILKETEDVTVH